MPRTILWIKLRVYSKVRISGIRGCIVLRNLNLIAPGSEAMAVSKVLNAAAWTYVAAFITSLAYFLWHQLPLLGGRQRN